MLTRCNCLLTHLANDSGYRYLYEEPPQRLPRRGWTHEGLCTSSFRWVSSSWALQRDSGSVWRRCSKAFLVLGETGRGERMGYGHGTWKGGGDDKIFELCCLVANYQVGGIWTKMMTLTSNSLSRPKTTQRAHILSLRQKAISRQYASF